jgi:hypothetical protein
LLDKQEEFNNMLYYAESIVTTIRRLIVLDKKKHKPKRPTHPSTKKNLIQKSKIQKEELLQNSSNGMII